MADGDQHAPARRLPAVVAGVLIGATVMAGVWTAPWWGARFGMGAARGASGPERPVGQVVPCLGGSTCLTPQGMPERQQHLIALVAGERARAGCRPAMLDSRLQAAAQDYAEAIATGSRPSHIDIGQRTPMDRAEAAGYHGRVQENLAVGVLEPELVIDMWLDGKVDPSLRTRLDNCAVIALGLGYSTGRTDNAYGPGVWVLLLGQEETG